jgi:hypothetical protein
LFLLSDGRSFKAGTAVCVRTAPGAKPLMLTALHLFGPAGGLKRDIAPGELDKQVRAAAATDLAGKQLLVKAQGTATHSGYPMTAQGDVSGDVVAFRMAPASKAAVLPLAPNATLEDSWLWLVGDVAGSKTPCQRLFPARVEVRGSTSTTVEFREDFPLTAFSGAPLVNARGEVAGLLIGGDGRRGWIITARLIHKRLAAG